MRMIVLLEWNITPNADKGRPLQSQIFLLSSLLSLACPLIVSAFSTDDARSMHARARYGFRSSAYFCLSLLLPMLVGHNKYPIAVTTTRVVNLRIYRTNGLLVKPSVTTFYL